MKTTSTSFLAAIALASTAAAQQVAGVFEYDVTPAFRGQPGARYAGWDAFTVAFGGPNLPDDADTDVALGGTLTQLNPGVILTSTMNLYGPGVAPSFEVDFTPSGDVREVALQTRSLGSLLDEASFVLVHDDGGSPATVLPTAVTRLDPMVMGGGFAVAEFLVTFDLPAGVSGPLTVSFEAAAANCSLAAVMLDVLSDSRIGSSYCSAVANSTGAPGELAAHGSDAAADNQFELRASGLPANVFGLYVVSATQGSATVPNGVGTLCLSGAIGRFNAQIFDSGTSGADVTVIDLTQLPTPTGFVSVGAGETWNFQAWHRDVVGGSQTSNFTLPVSVTFS